MVLNRDSFLEDRRLPRFGERWLDQIGDSLLVGGIRTASEEETGDLRRNGDDKSRI